MKAFSESEKEVIRKVLKEKGKRLFGLHGVKKTGVDELAKAASIAPGSFYAFYSSKEELFYEILMDEYSGFRENFEKAFSYTQEPVMILEKMISGSLDYLEKNPIIQRMLVLEDAASVFRKLTPEQTKALNDASIDPLREQIQSWIDKGILIPEKAEVLASIYTSLNFLTLHKMELGGELFPEVARLLGRFIAEGMVRKKP